MTDGLGKPSRDVQPLTRREREVLQLAGLGLTNAEIAGRLDVTTHAVKFHLSSIFRKLGVNNRTQAVVVALRDTPKGMIDTEASIA